MIKICIWTPTKSFNQKDFFNALYKNKDIDLEVRYFRKLSQKRKNIGWSEEILENYEKYTHTLSDGISSLEDFRDRIHIISGNGYSFTKALIDYCCENDFLWVNWTERSGRNLFDLLKGNYFLFKLIFPFYQRFYNRKFAKKINNKALGVFAIGQKAKEDYLKKGVFHEKVGVIYYSINPLKRKETKYLKNFLYKRKFIFIGELSKRKGVDILIRAFSKLNTSDWGLIMIGRGKEEIKYKALAKNLKVLHKIRFLGNIEFSEINEFLSIADVLILPSRFDGWGVVLNEGASLGMPLIATDECGAAYHLIKNNNNGFCIKANSVNDLMKSMLYYVNNVNDIWQHGKVSLELFKEVSPENNADIVVNYLQKWLYEKQREIL
jgi:glycosyltransferase involved in cell wall biosynthesis